MHPLNNNYSWQIWETYGEALGQRFLQIILKKVLKAWSIG